MTQLYTQSQKEKIEKLFQINDWYGKREVYTFALNREGNDRLLRKEEETTFESMLDELQPKTVLDYGSGYGVAIDAVAKKYPHIEFTKFDPFVPEYSTRPQGQFDLVVSHRVLRIVEENFREQVLQDMYDYAKHHLLLSILLYEVDGIPFSYYADVLSKYNVVYQGLEEPHQREGFDTGMYTISNSGFLIKK